MDSLLHLENQKRPSWIFLDFLACSTTGTQSWAEVTSIYAGRSIKDHIEGILKWELLRVGFTHSYQR